MMDFYAFLPSNASPELYPDNTTSHFITQLSQHMDLHGQWQAALIELHYPNTVAQVIQGENDITVVSDTMVDLVSVRPGSYSSVEDFLSSVNDALKSFDNDITQSNTKYYEVTNQRITFNPFDNDEQYKVHFSPRLALQLGLEHPGPYPANQEICGTKPLDISLGMPAEMFIYMNILSDQIIGHERAPLLRTVPLDIKAQHGTTSVVHFDHPLYFDLRTKSFDTLEIDIRDSAGRRIPFQFGTSTLLVHFRKLS